jgi:hypothetical protein
MAPDINESKNSDYDTSLDGDYEPRFIGYHDLMRFKIREILLVSSLYDAFTLEEDGVLSEQLFGEYKDLELTSPPRVIRVSSAKEALKELKERTYDLVITMTHLIDESPAEFGKKIKELQPGIPVVLLVTDVADLQHYHNPELLEGIDRVFFWTGDSRLFLAIVKYFEDRVNVDTDTKKGLVRIILVIEDSSRYYSMFLPLIYTEIMDQTQHLVLQGLNEHEKLLRRRGRPKILLARTYEEAEELYNKYRKYILAIITDVNYPHNGEMEKEAGFKFVEGVDQDIPILLQSTKTKYHIKADELGFKFLDKNSKNLFRGLRKFIKRDLGFGRFIFSLPDGTEVGQASDLTEFVDMIEKLPVESLEYHAENNHFSRWLMARGEFELAMELRPIKVTDFGSYEENKQHLIKIFRETSRKKQLGVITDFEQQKFEFEETITRLGIGSLGGKGRGIAFLSTLLQKSKVNEKFPEFNIRIPETLIIGTEEFDRFIHENDLHWILDSELTDDDIAKHFLQSEIADDIIKSLKKYLKHVKTPIAVRSSSLLEDSHNQPFAGIYSTYLLPNSEKNIKARLEQLIQAVKLVYASAFFQSAKAYIQATLHKAEEEKMGVVIQKVVGNRFDHRFYPIFSGVLKSQNFYPLHPLKREEPIASVAFGLGKIVVDGGQVLSFSPIRPNAMPGFSSVQEIIQNSQRLFYSLDLNLQSPDLSKGENVTLLNQDLSEAEEDNTLKWVASVYDPVDDRIRDGVDHEGRKVIMFAPILKYNNFPLVNILKELADIGERGMGCAVEMEFAVELDRDNKLNYYLLQIRPLISMREQSQVNIDETLGKDHYFVNSSIGMGNGVIDTIQDLLFVPTSTFDRKNTIEIANEIGELNKKLENDPYILIGPGRWGSGDRWLGIPVDWSQISNARTMVETPMEDIVVEPSHGSHFFHNVTSLGIPYLTVTKKSEIDFVDWEWLESLPVTEEKKFVKYIHLESPMMVKIDGRTGVGVIFKVKN